MVHPLLCWESLKDEGSQSHSAHQSQPQASHSRLRGLPQGGKARGWWLQGHILCHSPSSKAWWVHHLVDGGVLAASWGFLLCLLLLPQTLEGSVILACSQCCQWETKREQWVSLVLPQQRENHIRGKARAILQAALKDAALNSKSGLQIGSFGRERIQSPPWYFLSGRLMGATSLVVAFAPKFIFWSTRLQNWKQIWNEETAWQAGLFKVFQYPSGLRRDLKTPVVTTGFSYKNLDTIRYLAGCWGFFSSYWYCPLPVLHNFMTIN